MRPLTAFGASLFATKAKTRAIDKFRGSLRRDPSNALSYADLGVSLAKQGQREDAPDVIHVLHYWFGVLWMVGLMAFAHLWRVRRRSRIRVRKPDQVARLDRGGRFS